MTRNVETMIATENKQEATEVMEFLEGLNMEEKNDFKMFLQGVKLGMSMNMKATKQIAQPRWILIKLNLPYKKGK